MIAVIVSSDSRSKGTSDRAKLKGPVGDTRISDCTGRNGSTSDFTNEVGVA